VNDKGRRRDKLRSFFASLYKLFFLFAYFFYIQSKQFNNNQSLQP